MCLVRIVSDEVKFVIMMNWEETWEKNDTQPHKKDTNTESNFFWISFMYWTIACLDELISLGKNL